MRPHATQVTNFITKVSSGPIFYSHSHSTPPAAHVRIRFRVCHLRRPSRLAISVRSEEPSGFWVSPLPLRSHHAMRFDLAPERLRPPRPHNSCHLPFAGEAAAIGEPRDAAAAARSPPFHRANPPDCPHSFPARERRSPLACQSLPGSSPSAEDTRECAGRRDANAEACCP